jgi:hypothetical protein
MVSTSLQLRLNFLASKEETEGRFVCDLGNGQWDKIPTADAAAASLEATAIPLKTSKLTTPSPLSCEGPCYPTPAGSLKNGDDAESTLLAIEENTNHTRVGEKLRARKDGSRTLVEQVKNFARV